MSALQMFIPITKVDAAQRLVYGLATAEIEDRAGEVCDYATTKPLYERWSDEISKSSGGKSLGNLRAMHGTVAAGKVATLTFNDAAKQIEICAKVVDDAEWTKVVEGVYTGFSQGGAYAKRWTDGNGCTRYTAQPSEISLVDLPCLPQARFELIKSDGSRVLQGFAKGFDDIARLSNLLDELTWLQQAVALDQAAAGAAPSAVPAELKDLVVQMASILRIMVAEATDDVTAKAYAPRRSAVMKTGARNSAADLERIQTMHDTAVELGAACGAQKHMSPQFDKRFDAIATGLADILVRVRNIEAQPQPLPLATAARVVAKHDETSGDDPVKTAEHLLENPHALSLLAIKIAQRNGQRFGRG